MFRLPPSPFVTPPVFTLVITLPRFSVFPASTWMMPSVAATPNWRRGTFSVSVPAPVESTPPLLSVSNWNWFDAAPTVTPLPLIFSALTVLTLLLRRAFVVVPSAIKVFTEAGPKPTVFVAVASVATESVTDVPLIAVITVPVAIFVPYTAWPMARFDVLMFESVVFVASEAACACVAIVAFRSAPAPT